MFYKQEMFICIESISEFFCQTRFMWQSFRGNLAKSILKVETDIITSYCSESQRTSCDTSDDVC